MFWKVQSEKVKALWTKMLELIKSIPSTRQHVELPGNLGRPLSKAKYTLVTDSELVPWGKGEKNPDEGSEIESETTCLQAVGALCLTSVTAYLLHNESASYVCKQG